MSFLFGPSATAKIEFENSEERKLVKFQDNDDLPLFIGDENVKGTVSVDINGKPIEHNGIEIQLIGHIEMFYDRGNHYEFLTQPLELSPAGELTENKDFPFEFVDTDKQYESYNGINVRLRYFLRFTIFVKRSLKNIIVERDFWVWNYQNPPKINSSLKMEVGIEETLHIEFEYNRAKYHMKDVIIGKIYFLLVRINIKHMEIALIKRESTGSGPNLYNENQTLTKFEIMDGAPVRGESIPVRLFLSGFDLTPTYRNVASKFSLKYYLNLVLIDEDDRRYFKQQEITLWRKK
eukprot:TRINITY_DN55_c0_g1_i1.p1 TRINITY_DN55_c0_g1~~TRINITY_DN55_c0_g1_i1.p1  ORF type:complete len:292 (+),score=96.43 TRINITY_DN55_c0_g1_i1:45-920(+)